MISPSSKLNTPSQVTTNTSSHQQAEKIVTQHFIKEMLKHVDKSTITTEKDSFFKSLLNEERAKLVSNAVDLKIMQSFGNQAGSSKTFRGD